MERSESGVVVVAIASTTGASTSPEEGLQGWTSAERLPSRESSLREHFCFEAEASMISTCFVERAVKEDGVVAES